MEICSLFDSMLLQKALFPNTNLEKKKIVRDVISEPILKKKNTRFCSVFYQIKMRNLNQVK